MASKDVPQIFSPERRRLRDSRANALQRERTEPAGWFANAMVEDAIERIGFMRLKPDRALAIGHGAARLAEAIGPNGQVAPGEGAGEDEPFPKGGYDLIVSLGRLDTVNDLPGALVHHRLALAPGGILLAIIPGAGSLPMLRRIMLAADAERAAPRIHPQVDNRAATMLLERAGFARQVVDGHRLAVRYGSLTRLIADLREQALTSVLADPGPVLGRASLARAEAAFERLAEEDGKVSEHFELLTLTGWNS